MPAAVTAHLLGARGAVGSALAVALAEEPGVTLRGYSGEAGPRSYSAFLADYRADPAAVVVLAGGAASGTVAELVEGHVARAARLIDRFDAAGWPGRVLLVGSAAELLPGGTYGVVKAAQHRLVAAAATARAVPFVCLRLHSMVPLARPPRGLFAELLAQYEAGGGVSVHHLGGARDYVSSTQLVTAVAVLVAHPGAWAEPGARVLDVGNGVPVGVPSWLAAFRAVFGVETALEERAPGHADPVVVADATPLRELLARCDPSAVARYEAARPELEALIRGWHAAAS